MLSRPTLYASTSAELEISLLTAMKCWSMVAKGENGKRVVTLWRELVRELVGGESNARFGDGGLLRCVAAMRMLWARVRH